MTAAKSSQEKPPTWKNRNFITKVLIPSLLQPKEGKRRDRAPIFPKLANDEVAITWIGHASFLIQTPKHNILIDPNWANWMSVIRRLRHAGMDISHLPEIDLVLITHAHFDHLNKRSLKKVAARQPIVVPEGVGGLVHNLGFDAVHEMDRWDTWEFKKLKIIFTPAKHWGARMLVDTHRKCGGYIIEYEGRRIYHCGDSTYFDGFKEIGKRYAPEIALMPIGAYQPPSGRDHHIGPEQAIKAFQELKSRIFIPMHFGTYRLSFEPMAEPPQRLMKAALREGIVNKIRILTEGKPQVF
ncbi:MAG: MBL fold metallo-hydrolase [Verrucomicrobiales bacterium]|jgi:L-ascorbate metabolism protein UlaG (beta-lactamase superfamily)|nr:MBL fold metallo-hydrolase [Verrucomicrobiales bacterium]